MNRIALAVLIAVAAVALIGRSAVALPLFKKAFDEKYVKKSENESFKAAFRKASCNVCHVKGESDKKQHNDYGKELTKLIEGEAQQRLKDAMNQGPEAKKAEEAKLLKELEAAFEKVEKMKAPSGDETTYGERIEKGLLPVEQP